MAVSTPRAVTDLDHDLGWSLGVVFRAYVKSSAAVTADIPGGHRGFQVLTAAADPHPSSQSAIAARLGIDRTVMTYLLDDMERAGLIARRPDPADRRTRHIAATEHGRTRLTALEERLHRLETHIMAGLPADERQSLKALLRRLAAYINESDPVANLCDVVEDINAATSG